MNWWRNSVICGKLLSNLDKMARFLRVSPPPPSVLDYYPMFVNDVAQNLCYRQQTDSIRYHFILSPVFCNIYFKWSIYLWTMDFSNVPLRTNCLSDPSVWVIDTSYIYLCRNECKLNSESRIVSTVLSRRRTGEEKIRKYNSLTNNYDDWWWSIGHTINGR